jgi:high affinity Mn2+ porin
MFRHPDARYWVSGQDNIIWQAHPPFTGANSFRNNFEQATSNVATLYIGYSLQNNTQVFVL